jgi:hypothetical protein
MTKTKTFLEKNFSEREIKIIRKYERIRRTKQRKIKAGKK